MKHKVQEFIASSMWLGCKPSADPTTCGPTACLFPLHAESVLLPLLHDKLSALWLTVDQMDSKAACTRSLALLQPAWAADLHSLAPQHKLRLLQLGPSRFWRLVYLVHTGQHDCGTFFQYLNMSSPSFDRLFSEYGEWLDR